MIIVHVTGVVFHPTSTAAFPPCLGSTLSRMPNPRLLPVTQLRIYFPAYNCRMDEVRRISNDNKNSRFSLVNKTKKAKS